MKKLLLFAAMALLGMTACQEAEMSEVTSGEVDVMVTTTLPAELTPTRVAGDGTTVNRCIMEIYLNGALYGSRQVATVSNHKATFTARLVSGSTYDLVFWADKAGSDNKSDLHYDTSDLSNVTIADVATYTGNDETRDAFFGKTQVVADQTQAVSVTLKRPFGQLKVQTLDMADVPAAQQPTGVKIAFESVPTGIDLLTGELLTDSKSAVEYSAAAALVNNAGNAGELTFDYIFAPQSSDEQYLTDFTMSFYGSDNNTKVASDYVFTSIPVQRNYRTLVSGNLLTKKADVTVTVDPEFTDDTELDVTKVFTIEDANEAFKNGATHVVVEEAPTTDAVLVLPATTEDVSAVLPATTTAITVQYAAGATDDQKPATLLLSGEFGDLIVNTPGTSVTIMGSYANVTATTAAGALVVGDGATVENLTVRQGNVEVYGAVENLVSKPSSATVTLHAETVEDLEAFADNLNTTGKKIYDQVLLESDIDFGGAEFYVTRVNNLVLDGQGHRISNYKVEKNTQSAALFCDAVAVTVRNLTLENANVKAVNDGNGNAYAGALMGRTYGTITVENVHVVNPTVEGVNKVGGMVGFVAENHIDATNCSVEGGTVSTAFVEGESGQIGGLIGYLGSLYGSTCSIRNCSVENTVVNAYMADEKRTAGKFIGCFQGNEATDVLAIDNCTVTNVTLNGLDEMAAAHLSMYGELLGGQRYDKGTVTITNCDTAIVIDTVEQLFTFKELTEADNGRSFSNKTVRLGADIDLNDRNWVPANCISASKFVFDGQGHTIRNMSAVNNLAYGNGFFSNLTGNTVIKDVTFDNAVVSQQATPRYAGNCYGIISGYTFGTVLFENVHVKNSAIYGYGKIGGMVGMAGDSNGTTRFVNSSVENTSIAGIYNTGGLLGLAQNPVELDNATTSDVTWVKSASQTYVDLNETIEGPDSTPLTVNGTYWKYAYVSGGVTTIYYYVAWGDYYTDYYYAANELPMLDGYLADGMSHNK